MKQVYSLSRVIVFFFAVFCSGKLNSQVSVSISSQTNISCNGGNNGRAVALQSGGAGPFSYIWMPGNISGDTANFLLAGSYTVTVTDSSDMSTATASCTLTQPAALTATLSSNNVSCNGGNTGS